MPLLTGIRRSFPSSPDRNPMTRFARLFLATLIALVAVQFGVAGRAEAGPIENRASLSLQLGGTRQTYYSNIVVADRLLPPSPSTVTFMRSTTTGGIPIATDGGQCRGANGSFAASAPARAAGAGEQRANAIETSAVHAGEAIIVTVSDANRNTDPAVRELVEVAVTSSSGDEELLRLIETGPNTGLFAAEIETAGVPPSAVAYNCILSVGIGAALQASYTDTAYPSDRSTTSIIADPIQFVFDSQTGALIDGAEITLIDLATGQPALVFGDDGKSRFPATVVSGATVTDSAGRSYALPSGGFRFPVVAPGNYRLNVVPPAGYSGASQVPADQLRQLSGPAGAFQIDPQGSFLLPFLVNGAALLRIDVPLDPRQLPLLVRKSASVSEASAGDFIEYRVTVENNNALAAMNATVLLDSMSEGLRYKAGSMRIDGRTVSDPVVDPSGSGFRLGIGKVTARSSLTVTYVVQVTSAARTGDAVNKVVANANGVAASNEARALVAIRPFLMSDAATLIGRVFDGGCDAPETRMAGVPGVRILMEDGSYVLSDREGLFHFEGVRPGTHVVQLDVASLPEGFEAVQCLRDTRHGGSAISQFVEVRGGTLWRTNFHLRRTGTAKPLAAKAAPVLAADKPAAPATDWFAGQQAGNALLFPGDGFNPSSPAVRVVVKHLADTSLRLRLNGAAVPDINLDTSQASADKSFLVTQYQGLPLGEGDNRLEVEVRGAGGALLEKFVRTLHYANAVAHAELVPARSRLVADGRTRPVVAIRLTDRAGKPVRQGVTGTFQLTAPYRVASDLDLQQARQLSGADRAPPTWQVSTEDGIALVELAPTTQAGSIELAFTHQVERRQVREIVRGWMAPGDQPWVVVGFAAGTAGFNVLDDHQERLGGKDSAKRFTDGQIAFFAKGRILGKWLLTMAYDSDKKTGRDARRPLGGVIDPQRYYDLYADGTEQAYDAASARKVYLRLERPQFYALFGDLETGFNDTQLGRYSRSLTGLKSEYRSDKVAVQAFAADTGFRFARDEIQGSGLASLYRLSRTDIVINSDKVRIEVRDRLRSNIILSARELTRHADYDISYEAGSIDFRQPVTSRDPQGNPVFIVAEYETRGDGTRRWNGGLRAVTRLAGGRAQIGATLIRDADPAQKSDLAALDARVRIGEATEVRGEIAASRTDTGGEKSQGQAYLLEVEHRGETVDALAYFRQQDLGFGVGQLNRAESGTRKYGADVRLGRSQGLSLTVGGWHEDMLATGASRDALRTQVDYRGPRTSLRAGYQFARDHVPSGETLISQQATVGGSQQLFDNRLQLDADAAIGIGGKGESLDFPNRYRVGLSWALRPDVRLLASHEITDGAKVDTATTSLGIEAAPWRGLRLATTVNQQAMAEFGGRTYALYGISQSLTLSPRWSVDLSVDGSRTLKGQIDPAQIVNINHPVAAGGYLDSSKTISDDFWAVSTGATYRSSVLSWTGRAEYRRGDLDDRIAVSTALLRQTRDGISMAAAARFSRIGNADGSVATLGIANGAFAWRPLWSRWAVLDKLELRWDEVANGRGTTDGLLGFDGIAVVGNARTRRIVNNLAVNLVGAAGIDDRDTAEKAYERDQLSFYWGAKYVFDTFGADDYAGFSNMLGLEARHDLSDRLDLSLNAAVRHVSSTGTIDYLLGPSVGISPIRNSWISLGYNIKGFRDRDFSDARYTRAGPYVTLRFKFDQDTPAALFGRARSQ
ncbi:hypothetical protein GCM10022281_18390 [Sphingomonas rosea]|uniref:DUF11 domain-containing protein n=1 Tax=Sphingomonas rosea TaxID=335605 RepID=A0ABP7U8R7_9SPHN